MFSYSQRRENNHIFEKETYLCTDYINVTVTLLFQKTFLVVFIYFSLTDDDNKNIIIRRVVCVVEKCRKGQRQTSTNGKT